MKNNTILTEVQVKNRFQEKEKKKPKNIHQKAQIVRIKQVFKLVDRKEKTNLRKIEESSIRIKFRKKNKNMKDLINL